MDMFQNLLSRGGLSYDRLLNFCRIVEAGGIAKASDGDPGKQSLYSRQIRELEEFFGVELKRRNGKGIAITDAGRRLAQLARAHLLGLDDFSRECRDLPVTLSIGSGNSVIEWLLLPALGAVHEALPNVTFDLVDARTSENVRALSDMTLDLGLLRKGAVPRHLKSKSLGSLDYALFVPRTVATRNGDAVKRILEKYPLATSKGGSFRQILEESAAKAKIPLLVSLTCASFTQAARAVRSGKYAAILPRLAAVDLPKDQFTEIPLPFLRQHKRELCLVWNHRLASVRPFLSDAVEKISAMMLIPRRA